MDERPTTDTASPPALVALGEALFRRAADALLLVEEATERVVDANPAAEELTGTSAARLRGMALPALVRHEQDRPGWLTAPHVPAFREGFLARSQRADGWVHVSVAVARLEPPTAGEPLLLVSLRARPEAPAAAARLARLEAMAALAGTVAHDFNNLITGILGHVSLTRLGAGPHLLDGLAQIEAITLKAADLCRQLATFAGRSRGCGQIPDPAALVRDVLRQLEPRLPGQARLRLELAEGLPEALADEPGLRQALEALVANAAAAVAPEEGVVVVRVYDPAGQGLSPAEEGPPCFVYQHPELGRAAARVSFEVHDTGPGIPPEAQARLCEPFSGNRSAGGRGLGLALVLGTVRSHKGALRVWSRPGAGTRVRLDLPARARAAAARAPSAALAGQPAASAPPAPACTVLLADDEETVRDVATRLLSSAGYRVIQAKDGLEAVERYREHQADVRLAIIDLTMPRQSGEKTLRALRQLAPALPLVLMSGYPEADVLPRFADLRLGGYLQKPFRLPVLMDVLRQVLAG